MTNLQTLSTEEAFRRLFRHPSFRQLRRQGERFKPFEALGISYREHSHSSFLATLLDPRGSHGLQDHFLRDFIALVADSAPITRGRTNPLPLADELAIESLKVQISREWHNIDVLMDCLPSGPIIGIEVKIWAGEQDDQIKRYQELLERHYPERTSLVAFLTLDERKPETGEEGMKAPCVCISWASVAEIINRLLPSSDNETAKPFISAFAQHLMEITMGDTDDKALVQSLFKDKDLVNLFRKIDKLKPGFPEYSDKLAEAGKLVLEQVTNSLVKDHIYCPGQDNSVSFEIENWKSQGTPIRFVFYHNPPWTRNSFPGFHVLLFGEDFHEETKRHAYYEKVKQCSSLIGHELPVKGGWQNKYAVYKNPRDGQIIGWVIQDESFDEEWFKRALDLLREVAGQINDDLREVFDK